MRNYPGSLAWNGAIHWIKQRVEPGCLVRLRALLEGKAAAWRPPATADGARVEATLQGLLALTMDNKKGPHLGLVLSKLEDL